MQIDFTIHHLKSQITTINTKIRMNKTLIDPFLHKVLRDGS